MALLAASILDADYLNLEHEVTRIARAGIDAFSLDITDGHFAPRITFGDQVVARIRNWIELPIEVHLMIEAPEKFVQRYCDAGADMVLFHLEATANPHKVIDLVRREERSVGIAIKAETPIDAISDEILCSVDLINLLAVPIGFGGARTATDTVDRVVKIRERADRLKTSIAIEIDGGIKPDNCRQFYEVGADMLTSGTGIYHAPDASEAIKTMQKQIGGDLDAISRQRLSQFLQIPSRQPVDDAARRARLEKLRGSLDISENVWSPLTSSR